MVVYSDVVPLRMQNKLSEHKYLLVEVTSPIMYKSRTVTLKLVNNQWR